MRKWHRWLSVFFAIVLIWVTVTGVLHYVAVWWPVAEPVTQVAAPVEPAACSELPEGWRCVGPRAESGFWLRDNLGLIHHLHGGMEYGIWGEIIVMLSGLALLFFCISGIWMYFQMWNSRKAKGLKKKIFWK